MRRLLPSTEHRFTALGGCCQVVSSPSEYPEAAAAMERARSEYVVRVAGTLRRRKDPNPQLPTGAMELIAEEARIPGLAFHMYFLMAVV